MAAIVYGTRYDFHKASGGDDPASYKNTPADIDYLNRNTDVANAVAAGDFVSGYDHWLKYGKAEYEQNAEADKLFGTPGYEAVKSKWPYKRYYNLALNAAPKGTKSNTAKYLMYALLLGGAIFAFMKLSKKK